MIFVWASRERERETKILERKPWPPDIHISNLPHWILVTYTSTIKRWIKEWYTLRALLCINQMLVECAMTRQLLQPFWAHVRHTPPLFCPYHHYSSSYLSTLSTPKRSISNPKHFLNNYFDLLLILSCFVMKLLGLNKLQDWICLCVFIMICFIKRMCIETVFIVFFLFLCF